MENNRGVILMDYWGGAPSDASGLYFTEESGPLPALVETPRVMATMGESGRITAIYTAGDTVSGAAKISRLLQWRRRIRRLPSTLRFAWTLFWHSWR